MTKQKKRIEYILLLLGIAIVLFMHLYKLTEIPYGLNVDEAAAAYEALNIANYGVDRWLNSYPVYFTNYADGQNALYIYATAVLIKLFGVSRIVIRATIVIAAFVGGLAGYLYVRKEYGKPMVANVFLLLYGAIPVFTTMQRFGLESHLMLSMAMVSILCVALAMEKSDWKFYLLAGSVCGMTLYTYALAYIVVPIFVVLCCIYMLRLKELDVKKTLAFCVPLCILAFPLVLVQVVNYFDLPQIMLGPITITKLNAYRAEEVSGFNAWQQFCSMLKQTFVYGEHAYNSPRAYGTMYYVSIPFITIGFSVALVESVKAFCKKEKSYSLPVVAWTIGQFVMGSTLANPNNTRMNGIFIPLLYFLVKGIYFVVERVKKLWLRRCAVCVIAIVYFSLFVSFSRFYFTEYNEVTRPFDWLFYESYEEVGDFVEVHKGEPFLERTTCYPWNYIYYCLEYEVNPYEMNIPVNGIETFRQDNINEFPGALSLISNYVVYKTDLASMEYLERLGYQKEVLGEFTYYINPCDTFECEVLEGVTYVMDRVDVVEAGIELSGWCVNDVQAQVFERMYLLAGEERYNMEQRERSDVANHLGSEEYLNAGYRVELPKSFLRDMSEFSVFAQIDGEEIKIVSWRKK